MTIVVASSFNKSFRPVSLYRSYLARPKTRDARTLTAYCFVSAITHDCKVRRGCMNYRSCGKFIFLLRKAENRKQVKNRLNFWFTSRQYRFKGYFLLWSIVKYFQWHNNSNSKHCWNSHSCKLCSYLTLSAHALEGYS